ncbi:hypothetical protein [Arthrobacter sp. UYCu723]
MTAFATHEALSARMKRTFTTDEQAWATTLLEDAAGFLRGVMHAAVYPVTTSTFTAWPSGGRVDLPQPFVFVVDGVTRGGVPLPFKRREDSVYVDGDDECDVTFTYGLATAPPDLVGLNCAIVSGQIMLVEAELGLQVGGLSSVALDDFKIAFADGGAATGLSLPDPQLRYLRETYGTSGWVVGTSL